MVSGDFWWAKDKNINGKSYTYLAVADCTGHGVPGAMMSMLGGALLNELTAGDKLPQPNEVLGEMRERIKFNLNQDKNKKNNRADSMEMGLCLFDRSNNKLYYSGAGRPLYSIKANSNEPKKIEIYKGNRQPVGIYVKEKPFNVTEIDYKEGDAFFMFSDGITDQFNEDGTEKYGQRRLKQFLVEEEPNEEFSTIKNKVSSTLKSWSGKMEQIDDQILVGIKI